MAPTGDAPVLVERDGAVEIWTLNRPDVRNPLTDEPMIRALLNLVEAVNDDLSVGCVVLTGAGRAFSAGGNVKDMRDRRGMFGGDPAEIRRRYRAGIQRVAAAVTACEVPIVAAVNGPAVGAGCDLALMADIRIASPEASFAESFVRLGLIPGDGGAWLLPRAVGASRAAEMTFSGDPVDAETAAAWGLVSRVVPRDELLLRARALAHRIARNPSGSLRMAKVLLRQADRMPYTSVLEMSAGFQAIAHHTAEHAQVLDDMGTGGRDGAAR
ncbi:crotonase/enoyl-CoA hydratase family protein [Streptomyces sp. NPDC020792]|uniref:crotonase/enoyl-CoA hydratase family protein n=1 Tax=Streptomyces sp. NPDC020792 TaxID=3365089 RepID=UPI0037A6838C